MLSQCFRRSFNPSRRGLLSLRPSWVPPVQQQASRPRKELHDRAPRDAAPKFNDASRRESATRRLDDYGSVILVGAAFLLLTYYLETYLQDKFQDSFRPFQLLRRDAVSPTMSVFYLKPKPELIWLSRFLWPGGYRDLGASSDVWKSGIWHVFFKQPQIQVVRAYTPLPPISGEDSEQPMRFLIRHDQRGEVSSWLHRLPDGAHIEMKGPNLEMEIPTGTRRITFLAGGTGIATALQAAYALLNPSPHSTSPISQLPVIHILWASRLREDCEGGVSDHSSSSLASKSTIAKWGETSPGAGRPTANSGRGLIVRELDALKQQFPGQVAVDYFVDEEDTWISDSAIIQSIAASGQSDQIRGISTHQMIISGPDGFIDHMAGPKIWREGRQEQGPVTGVVARALAETNNYYKVWKV